MVTKMNLNQLRIFQSAARLLNFTRTAEELHLTQPGISKHLKELEEHYGTRLFERLGKKVVLTQAGEALYEATSTAFSHLDAARIRIEELNGLAAGVLAIGASTTIGAYLLPDWLVQFRQRYPAIDIRVETGFSSQIAGRVLDGSIELGLVGHYSPQPRLMAKPFMTDHLKLIVSPRHPWVKKNRAVSLDELAEQTLLLARRSSGTWKLAEALMSKKGIQPGKLIELGTSEAVKRALAANLGVALLSGHLLEHELANGTLKAIPLAGGEPKRVLYLIQQKNRYLSRAAQAFVELLFE